VPFCGGILPQKLIVTRRYLAAVSPLSFFMRDLALRATTEGRNFGSILPLRAIESNARRLSQ
jgi:hypothetical protein